MNIRTITVGAREEDVPLAAKAAHASRTRLEAAGYRVQTIRLALSTSGSNRCADFTTVARGAEQLAIDHGFDFVSLGRIDIERMPALPEALAATELVTANARIAGRNGVVDGAMIHAAAAVIPQIAALTPLGFGNMRFAAVACMAPGYPFFPASHHDGGGPWLAIGLEAAALAITAIGEVGGVEAPAATPSTAAEFDLRSMYLPPSLTRLTSLIEQYDQQIRAALEGVESDHGIFITGCDWSLAPQPNPATSIGAAIELLSGVPFGEWGTLAAVRSLTDAIRAAKVNLIGFSGVMLPIMEDIVLAQRSIEGRYTLRDLLAFSAVCGNGLDTIPLPGDTSAEQIAGVLHEVAALAGALRKPLVARLLPMPGLRAGEITQIDYTRHPEVAEFFCQSAVLAV
jgi:uncharacterized protein